MTLPAPARVLTLVRSDGAVDASLDVHAGEPSPAYPALAVRAAEADRREGVRLRVRSAASHGELLDRIAEGESALAILSPTGALRALANGLAARIVCTAVSPADLSYLDLHVAGADERGATGVRAVLPRALIVAPLARLEREPERVAAALRCYWRGAELAAASPALLAAALADEFGFVARAAEREALRAIGLWRLEPALARAGLEAVLGGLKTRREVPPGATLAALIDDRFASTALEGGVRDGAAS